MRSPTEPNSARLLVATQNSSALSQQQYRRVQQQKRAAQLVEQKVQSGKQGQTTPESSLSFTSHRAGASGGQLLRRERNQLVSKKPYNEWHSQAPTEVDRLSKKEFCLTNPTDAGLFQQQTTMWQPQRFLSSTLPAGHLWSYHTPHSEFQQPIRAKCPLSSRSKDRTTSSATLQLIQSPKQPPSYTQGTLKLPTLSQIYIH